MTDDWDFYALRVDDAPASIFVDLGIEAEAPLKSHPFMAYVRLYMNHPRADGLSSQEEFSTLVEIENALEAGLCGSEVGYVGRNTSGGCRDFYFYVVSDHDWELRVREVLTPLKRYDYETGSRADPDWSAYLNFLLPGPVDRRRIKNRRVCQVLERLGDPLLLARELDHWCYFPSPQAVDAFVADIASDGFQLRERTIMDAGPLRFGAQVWRVDTPAYGDVDGVTLALMDAAMRHGGDYDGWECPVKA